MAGMKNFDELRELAQKVQQDPSNTGNVKKLADGIIEVDRQYASGQGQYPQHWQGTQSGR